MEETKHETLVKPVDTEKMPAEEAGKIKGLLMQHRAKYVFEVVQRKMAIAGLEAAVAKTDLVVADLERKVAGVDYPERPGEPAPEMGAPVGGK